MTPRFTHHLIRAILICVVGLALMLLGGIAMGWIR